MKKFLSSPNLLPIILVLFSVVFLGTLGIEQLSKAVDSGVLGRSMKDPRCPVCGEPAEALHCGNDGKGPCLCYKCLGWN